MNTPTKEKQEKISKRFQKAIESFKNGESKKNKRQNPTFLFYPDLKTKPFFKKINFLWAKGIIIFFFFWK